MTVSTELIEKNLMIAAYTYLYMYVYGGVCVFVYECVCVYMPNFNLKNYGVIPLLSFT